MIFIPIIIVYLFVITLIMAYVGSNIPINDYKYYKKILNNKYEYQLVNKFPKEIPNSADNILFHYHVGMPRAETVLNIYYKIDNSTIKEYVNRYSHEAVRVEQITDDNIYKNIYKLYLNNVVIDYNYTIYYLIDDYDRYSYIAINENSNECIFVFNYW